MFDKKAVFINTASQVIVRFVTLALTLVSVKLLSNYLGTAGLGSYNTITTYINFFIVIADLGLFSVTVREIAKNPNNEKRILSNVFVVRLVSALIASIIAISIVYFTNYSQEIKLGTLIAAGFLFFNLLGSVYDIVLQYRLKMQYSALAEFLSKTLSIIAIYLIILTNAGFLAIMSTVALYGFLIFVTKWLFAKRYVAFGPKYNKEVAKWIFGLSWPIGIVFIMNNIFMKIDTLMVFGIKGAADAGIYTVAYKVLEVTAFIGAYFASALKPSLAENIHSNKQSVKTIIEKGIFVMTLAAVPVTVAAIVFSKEIILFLSSPEFLPGATALVLLALVLPFIYIDVLLSEIYIANDERKLMLKIFAFIVSFNIILNLLIIPRYSFVGAAFTTLLSEIVLLLINYRFTQRIISYRVPRRKIAKVIAAGLATLIIILFIKETGLHFLLLIGASFAVYGIFLLLLKTLALKDIKELIKP